MILSGGTAAFNFLANGNEISDVTSVTISDIEIPTTELKGAGIMGAVNIPASNQVNTMTMSVSVRKTGANKKYLFAEGSINIEIRVATDIRQPSGEIVAEGTKIFASAYATKLAGGKVETGASRDETVDYSVHRYREIVDGVETILIDQFNNVLKIGGRDRGSSIRSILR